MAYNQSRNDWSAVKLHGKERRSRWLILCDHASNTVPPFIADPTLGLPDTDMQRHIAFDIGAAGVATYLADALNAPAVFAEFSRLVIDPNRGADDPTLIRRLYDETIIPSNRHIGEREKQSRIDQCYQPYHDAIAQLARRHSDTVIVSVHSFTPQLRNHPPRPWHIGLLFASDARLSKSLSAGLQQGDRWVIGENEPYPGYLKGDTIDQHASAFGRQNTLIEIRNDLISDKKGQKAWAERLATLLPTALQAAEQSE